MSRNLNCNGNNANHKVIKEQAPFPWFGMDVGGTLVKLVYFEPLKVKKGVRVAEETAVKRIQKFLCNNAAYGQTGVRDVHLQIKVCVFFKHKQFLELKNRTSLTTFVLFIFDFCKVVYCNKLYLFLKNNKLVIS